MGAKKKKGPRQWRRWAFIDHTYAPRTVKLCHPQITAIERARAEAQNISVFRVIITEVSDAS